MSARPPAVFLTAQWLHLVLLNYEIEPAVLAPLVPRGTELDAFEGRTMVSLVGFTFADTRVCRVPIPLHRTFEEVNLRFYVRRLSETGELRRGVVFIRELVPRHAIAAVARWLYNEPYLAVPMSRQTELAAERGGNVSYRWRFRGTAMRLSAEAHGPSAPLMKGSEAEFITEHYWGYTRQRDGGTLEYEVVHPPWRVWTAVSPRFEGDATALYGSAFADVLRPAPRSAFVALGSEIAVRRGRRIATQP